MEKDLWERQKEYMESGMSFGEAISQAQLDIICEEHDNMIDELYPIDDSRNYESDPEDRYSIRDIEGE